ncbi:MAG: septum formation initiator family protein [Pseudomonadota bacterium]
MKATTVLLVTLLASTQYALWIGDKNVFDLLKLSNTSKLLQQENALLLKRNQKLLAEVIDLKNGGETIETLARYELGLIKPNETFYQIVD